MKQSIDDFKYFGFAALNLVEMTEEEIDMFNQKFFVDGAVWTDELINVIFENDTIVPSYLGYKNWLDLYEAHEAQ
jgi:hypothetical protein